MQALSTVISFPAPLLRKADVSEIRRKPTTSSAFGKITEIVTQCGDITEIPMLMPLLAQLSHSDRWFVWVSPPSQLPKALLLDAGVDLKKVIMLYPNRQHSTLELAQKALSAGTCHVVISWTGDLSDTEMQALEHSALHGRSNGILIRGRQHH